MKAKRLILIVLITLIVVLSGCAVTPDPFAPTGNETTQEATPIKVVPAGSSATPSMQIVSNLESQQTTATALSLPDNVSSAMVTPDPITPSAQQVPALPSPTVTVMPSGSALYLPSGQLIISAYDNNGVIYVVNADGSGEIELAQNPSYYSDIVLSPDGSQMAFTTDRDGNREIYSVNFDGEEKNLTENSAEDYGPVWLPDSTRLLFKSDRDDWRSHGLYMMNTNNSEVTGFTSTGIPPNAHVDYDTVSPDTRYLVVRTYDNTGIVAAIDTSRVVISPITDQVPLPPQCLFWWSPDSTQIACSSYRQEGLYVVNIGSSEAVRLTTDVDLARTRESVIWSPDSKKIAFRANRDGKDDLFVVKADGSGEVRLTNNSSTEDGIAWSPDSSRIAFAFTQDGSHHIYIINADGSNLRRLTTGETYEWYPLWSPDGEWIAFAGGSVDRADIYVVNVAGSEPIHLGTYHLREFIAWQQ